MNEYDAVIMGQSQFDLLKISKERRIEILKGEINNILNEISELDSNRDRLSIKILERTKKSLEKNLEKLMDSKEETILDFEQLGIDMLYIDEAHLYKNLYFITKLRNVAGINQTASQKALNLKMKMEYIEEIGGKITFATGTPISNTMAEMYTMQRYLMQDTLQEQGIYNFDSWHIEEIGGKITFATGTPISNTMAEMYTMQRYLMQDTLQEQGIYNFDSWQKIFASTETKLEISPAGNGFQLKTRFSNFRNIPELMNLYNSVADVVTAEMINLPVPKYTKELIEAETSEELAIEMNKFGKRAESCKKGKDPRKDNMLKIVNEGRYAGLDIRHVNESYPDYEDSKVNLLIDKVVKNSKDREKMFEKVRSGDIRVIIGSTSKMGAGTNFQNKLIALYHLDTPWRPRID